jgi:hypothetical protein
MAVAKTVTKNLPPWAQGFAQKLDLMGEPYHFLEQYHLIDLGKHVQVRDEEDVANAGSVREYTERMLAGNLFPPAVITADDYLVDGATRMLAAAAAGRKYFPVLKLVNRTYHDALAPDVEKLVTIGSVFNNDHGKVSSAKSKVRAVEWIASVKGENVSTDDIASQLHLKRSFVRAALTAKKGKDRAEDLGVNLARRKLSQTHVVNLGTMDKLNDEPFRAFAELTTSTTISTTEQQDIMRRLGECRNDADRMKILAAEQESRKDNSSGVNRRPPVSAALRQHLGFIIKQGGIHEGELLVETGSLKAGSNQYEVMGQAIETLRKARSLQYVKNQELIDLDRQAKAALAPSFSG